MILKISKSIATTTKETNLCLAGGVALNCVANGLLAKEKIFKNIWIQPAAGDAGGALGAAMLISKNIDSKNKYKVKYEDLMQGSFLGPSFSNDEIKKDLVKANATFHVLTFDEIIKKVTDQLIKGKIIGWMQGRMEFGPRALGARSIIADPRPQGMQNKVNMKIKFREGFRPFAPSILSEHLKNWFDLNVSSPYMLFVGNLKKTHRIKLSDKDKKKIGLKKLDVKRSRLPAITHVNYSARIHSVEKSINPKFYRLISNFFSVTKCPVLLNTSFNVRGEPLVCSPKDAFKCFMGTNIDILVIENFILFKEEQRSSLKLNYEDRFELD